MKCTKVQRTRQSTNDNDPSKSWMGRSEPSLRGIRTKYVITHNPSTQLPMEDVVVRLSDIGGVGPIDPNTINLRFIFNKSDKDATLYNNLSANLVQRLTVTLAGKTLYDNAYENLIRVYSDLWLSQRGRDELAEYGLCDSLLRGDIVTLEGKSKEEATVTKQVVSKMMNIYQRQKISIGKIITDQGIVVPSANDHNLEFTLTLAYPSKVVSKGTYSLTNMEVEYDSYTGPSIRALAVEQYTSGKCLPFKGISWLRQNIWSKDNMLLNETINVSKKCLNQIIVLFTKPTRSGSEEFVYPGINKVNVTMKGVPGTAYNAGITSQDLLTEASKTFSGHMKPYDFYCNNMFTLCVDLRSTYAPDEYGNGRNTLGGSDIVLEIQRTKELSPNEDLRYHVFTAYDSILNMNTKGLLSIVV